MHNTYLLLRNNQQSGPYSLQDLVQQNLKPFDLVWEEGKSAGWRYPAEVDSLTPFLPKPEAAGVENKTTPAPVSAAPTAHPATSSTRHIYISLPPGKPAATVAEQPRAAAPALTENLSQTTHTEESEITKEEKEKTFAERAEKLRQRAASFAATKQLPDEEPQVKYTRSLDDIKEEYTSWLSQQKGKNKFAVSKNKIIIPALAALVILAAVAIWKMGNINALNQQATASPLLTNSDQHEASQPLSAANHTLAAEKRPLTDNKQTVAQAPQKKRTANTQTAAKKPAATYTQHTTEPVSVQTEGVAVKMPAPEASATEKVVLKEAAQKENKNIPLTQLIDVNAAYIASREPGLAGVKITVHNNSNQLLKVVAVDVFYTGKNNALLQKKTIYFSNIPPQDSASAIAPGNRKADAARCELGLLSSESGALYVSK